MKKFILILALAALQTGNYFAQSPSWQWARSAGSTGNEAATGSALDASGNLYVVGWYTSANITFGGTTLTNPGAGTSDIFLVKYDAAGNALWAKTYGGVDGELGNGVAVDAAGNIHITGLYTSPAITMGSYTLTNSATGSSDILIAKIDPSGNVIWAKSAGGNSADKGNGITVDASGNVYTTGSFNSAMISFGTNTLTNAGSGTPDFFLLKHDSNGNPVWARSAGGLSPDGGNSAALDSLGNVYITGQYASSIINFGTGVLTNAASGMLDLFVVKYNGAGTAVWSQRSGGSFDDFGNGISIQKGDVYVTGGFNSSSVTFSTTTLTNASAGTCDVLLVKYDFSGNAAWAVKAGSTDSEAGNGVAVNLAGDVFVSGYFASGNILFGSTTLTNAGFGYKDLFIAAFNSAGSPAWATTSTAGIYDEIANCISVSGSDVYIGGLFNSPMVSFGTSNISKGCGDDVFVAKLLGPLVGIMEEDLSNQLTVYPNPTSGKFSVEAEGQIMFYNVLGENVLNAKLKNENKFDFSSFPKGVYLYRVLTEKKGAYTGRVVVE